MHDRDRRSTSPISSIAVTAREAIHIILSIGLGAALIRFGMLERRAHRDAERLANRIKERRTELGLTQAELAERVGVTRKTVNTVENASSRLRPCWRSSWRSSRAQRRAAISGLKSRADLADQAN